MPQVAVKINGKIYRMACDEGQEAHLLELAQKFDEAIQSLKESFGEMGDQRLAVMAGIMAHDKLQELQKKFENVNIQLKQQNENKIKEMEKVNKIAQQVIDITKKISSKT